MRVKGPILDDRSIAQLVPRAAEGPTAARISPVAAAGQQKGPDPGGPATQAAAGVALRSPSGLAPHDAATAHTIMTTTLETK